MTDQDTQQEIITEKLRSLLAKGLVRTFSGTVFRIASENYAKDDNALNGQGARRSDGRYHRPEFEIPVVYTGTTRRVTQAETVGVTADQMAQNLSGLKKTQAIVEIEVNLSQVLDLTDSEILTTLGVNESELFADWKKAKVATVTQTLGKCAREVGFEAILSPSAALPGTWRNLNIFPDKVAPKSSFKLIGKNMLIFAE
jgi:RES domain-containing protein